MWFLQSLKAGVYDPIFYRSMRERKGSSAFGYFAIVIALFAVIASVAPVRGIATFVFQPSAEKDAFRQQVLAMYPDDLRFDIGNGKLSMNKPSPYVVPMPKDMANGSGKDGSPKNLLVINTERAIATDDFKTYDTLAVLSADSVGFFDQEKGKIQIQSLESVFASPFVLDKTQYASFVDKLEKMLKGFGIAALFLMPFFIFSGMMIMYVVYLVLGALAIWVAARLCGAAWSYGTAYKAGLYLITVPLLYGQLVSSGVIPMVPVPLFFTIILFVMALINISKDVKISKDIEEAKSAEVAVESSEAAAVSDAIGTKE